MCGIKHTNIHTGTDMYGYITGAKILHQNKKQYKPIY